MFQSKLYRQSSGTKVRSTLASIVSNIFKNPMKAVNCSFFWMQLRRYGCDMLMTSNIFWTFQQSIYSDINFTIELKSNIFFSFWVYLPRVNQPHWQIHSCELPLLCGWILIGSFSFINPKIFELNKIIFSSSANALE